MPRHAPNKMPPAVKRRYFELIRSGWSGAEAARRVGVSISCGSLWYLDAGRVRIAVCDGLKGLPETIKTVSELTTVQACIIHLIRNTFRYALRKYWTRSPGICDRSTPPPPKPRPGPGSACSPTNGASPTPEAAPGRYV